MMIAFASLARLSNDELLGSLGRLVHDHSRLTAAVVAHLAEVERRRLHAHEGYASLFAYCTEVLHLSEPAAYLRIQAARLARRFPVLLDALAQGDLHLSAIKLLGPHLTADNQAELVGAATGCTVRQLEQLLATRSPQPDAPTRLRRLPAPRAKRPPEPSLESSTEPTTQDPLRAALRAPSLRQSPTDAGLQEPLSSRQSPTEPPRPALRAPSSLESPTDAGLHEPLRTPSSRQSPTEPMPHEPLQPAPQPQPPSPRAGSPGAPARPPRSPRLIPLAAARYKLEVTLSQATRDKLQEARDLLRHALPGGDLDTILSQALDLLIENTKRRRFGSPDAQKRKRAPASLAQAEATGPKRQSSRTSIAPSSARNESTKRSRRPCARARRAVFERDGGRCTYVSPEGRRCTERGALELNHRIPYARGGTGEIDNLEILCRSHNLLQAERDFGPACVARAVADQSSP